MIHHQRRRDLADAPAHASAEDLERVEEAPAPAGTDPAAEATPVVPRQERRPARDAYDLYAQIYAIRTEDHRA